MKRTALLLTALMTLGTSIVFAQDGTKKNSDRQNYNQQYKAPEHPRKPVAYTKKSVAGPDKSMVTTYTITYPYAASSIEKAILEKFKTEGLSYKKAKNSFYAVKGVKYNALWNRTFDMYVAVTGSNNSGTIYLLISAGYDNYITDEDPEVSQKISEWLVATEKDILTYLHNEKISDAEKELKEAEKEVDKLKKERTKIEKNIEKNNAQAKAFEARRIIPDENNINSIDTKLLEKEQKQATKYADTDKKYQFNLDENTAKLKKAESEVNDKKETVRNLKANKPQ